MKPGRDLDALIAEKVFGWKRIDPELFGWHDHDGDYMKKICDVPFYSTSIEAAWEVVNNFESREYDVQLILSHGEQVKCRIGKMIDILFNSSGFVYSDTAPHAICLAALKAVEGE